MNKYKGSFNYKFRLKGREFALRQWSISTNCWGVCIRTEIESTILLTVQILIMSINDPYHPKELEDFEAENELEFFRFCGAICLENAKKQKNIDNSHTLTEQTKSDLKILSKKK